ncbi:MAG TPA: hypothetical protein P5572_17920 [Phycisphaerae bacterium]|nr:hypothetical protein [Phycisphaerales bacterium]HRX86906.1 hypothetical protein [Phycisphaerae bacterium]
MTARTNVGWTWRTGLLLGWVIAIAGCPAPPPQQTELETQQATPEAALPLAARSAPGSLDDRIADYHRRLHECLPGDDLGEDLYLGWMLEPYERATLAVALKAVAVLEREQHLRQKGVGNLSAERTAAISAWLDHALAGGPGPVAIGFQPTRIQPATDLAGAVGEPAYFTFADRASFTAQDRTLGDLDLLASAGFRWYAWDAATALTSAGTVRRARAQSMGCALLEAPARFRGERRAPAGSADLALQPLTLAQMFVGNLPDGVPAVIDLPDGEDLVGMLARRQLMRGVTSPRPFAAIGVDAGGPTPQEAAARVRAAMWLQAVAGQRIGVFEGWRDARDGTLTPYASRFAEPEYLEAVAHTALDLLRFSPDVAALRTQPDAVIVLPEDFAVAGDRNQWSTACVALLAEAHASGRAFDIAPSVAAAEKRRYALVIDVQPVSNVAMGQVVVADDAGRTRIACRVAPTDIAAARVAGAAIANVLMGASEPPAGASGSHWRGVIQRLSANGRTCLAVNCTPANTSFLVTGTGSGSDAPWSDRLAGEQLDPGPIPLRPWQVRLLYR